MYGIVSRFICFTNENYRVLKMSIINAAYNFYRHHYLSSFNISTTSKMARHILEADIVLAKYVFPVGCMDLSQSNVHQLPICFNEFQSLYESEEGR